MNDHIRFFQGLILAMILGGLMWWGLFELIF